MNRNYLGWLIWTYVRLTTINYVFSALSQKTLEKIPATFLIHFRDIPAPFKKYSTRKRSAIAHSQYCTTAAVKNGHSKLRCGMAHSRLWKLMTRNFIALWTICLLAHFNCWFYSKLVQTTFLLLGVRRLTLINRFNVCFHKLHWSNAYLGSLPIDEHIWTNVVE